MHVYIEKLLIIFDKYEKHITLIIFFSYGLFLNSRYFDVLGFFSSFFLLFLSFYFLLSFVCRVFSTNPDCTVVCCQTLLKGVLFTSLLIQTALLSGPFWGSSPISDFYIFRTWIQHLWLSKTQAFSTCAGTCWFKMLVKLSEHCTSICCIFLSTPSFPF